MGSRLRSLAVTLFGIVLLGLALPAPATSGPLAARGSGAGWSIGRLVSVWPQPARSEIADHTFLFPDGRGGSLARWNPCQPIRYAVNTSDLPSFGLADLQAALAQVTAATGIRFEYVGTTDFVPSGSPVDSYPAGVDAVVGWVSAAQFPLFASPTEAGYGGAQWVPSTSGGGVITHGYALVSGAAITRGAVGAGFSSGVGEGHLLLHEVGHMMGLGHAANPADVMYPTNTLSSATSYGPGDLAGLRQLSSGGCLQPVG
ncbi:MAG TPA: matrixin family metalloprotease [Acidimicrobiales bacterium]|nr:matrixin family metalloprotease [Acidimicrobiales bacterium]